MYWEDRENEKVPENLKEDFYLERPEDKVFYPIDLSWDVNKDSLEIKDKYNVNIEDGLKRPIEIIEVDLKKYKKKYNNGRQR
jgi:hypothetical protein